jgi:hypothetical protein
MFDDLLPEIADLAGLDAPGLVDAATGCDRPATRFRVSCEITVA